MKKILLLLIMIVSLFSACKKKDVEKTTTEKVLGIWKINNIVYKEIYNGTTNNSSYNGIVTDVMDFRADGKIYWNFSGVKDTSVYSILSDSKLQFDGDQFDIRTLTDNQMSLYNKDISTSNPANTFESTYNLSK
jgi:outer membrane lipoprotein-sorting protein